MFHLCSESTTLMKRSRSKRLCGEIFRRPLMCFAACGTAQPLRMQRFCVAKPMSVLKPKSAKVAATPVIVISLQMVRTGSSPWFQASSAMRANSVRDTASQHRAELVTLAMRRKLLQRRFILMCSLPANTSTRCGMHTIIMFVHTFTAWSGRRWGMRSLMCVQATFKVQHSWSQKTRGKFTLVTHLAGQSRAHAGEQC